MARDFSLAVRMLVIGALKDATAVSDQVDDRIYGPAPPAEPVWPFIRYGLPTVTPFVASCLDGSRIAMTLHGFAKGPDETGVTNLCSAMAGALGDISGDLSEALDASVDISWNQTQYLRDTDEASGWHGIVSFTAEVTA